VASYHLQHSRHESASCLLSEFNSAVCLLLLLQVTVAVCDSGVDSTHPDLAYAGGQTWVREPSDSKPGDMVDAGVDFYGHGALTTALYGIVDSLGTR
jgi:hypothetical protein